MEMRCFRTIHWTSLMRTMSRIKKSKSALDWPLGGLLIFWLWTGHTRQTEMVCSWNPLIWPYPYDQWGTVRDGRKQDSQKKTCQDNSQELTGLEISQLLGRGKKTWADGEGSWSHEVALQRIKIYGIKVLRKGVIIHTPWVRIMKLLFGSPFIKDQSY